MVLRRGVREFEVVEMRRDLSAAWLLYIDMLNVASAQLGHTRNRCLRRDPSALFRCLWARAAKVVRKISCNIKGEAHSQGILADAVSAGELVASCRSPSFTKNTCRRVES